MGPDTPYQAACARGPGRPAPALPTAAAEQVRSGAPAPLSPPVPAGALPAAALGQAFSAAHRASLRAFAQAANDRSCWTA